MFRCLLPSFPGGRALSYRVLQRRGHEGADVDAFLVGSKLWSESCSFADVVAHVRPSATFHFQSPEEFETKASELASACRKARVSFHENHRRVSKGVFRRRKKSARWPIDSRAFFEWASARVAFDDPTRSCGDTVGVGRAWPSGPAMISGVIRFSVWVETYSRGRDTPDSQTRRAMA
jgi:hypothetical protein